MSDHIFSIVQVTLFYAFMTQKPNIRSGWGFRFPWVQYTSLIERCRNIPPKWWSSIPTEGKIRGIGIAIFEEEPPCCDSVWELGFRIQFFLCIFKNPWYRLLIPSCSTQNGQATVAVCRSPAYCVVMYPECPPTHPPGWHFGLQYFPSWLNIVCFVITSLSRDSLRIREAYFRSWF